uniref:Ig-like domain-containing protein n=2 Tax=Salarias fasciatus TaxID=181472 RepID=A0A672HDF3_SALFA
MNFGPFSAFCLLVHTVCASSVRGDPQTVVAVAGDVTLLPCRFSVSESDLPGVEWSREDLDRYVVLLYQDGRENHEMKNQSYEHRTSLLHRELKMGVVSLRLSDVRSSDAGTYHCKQLTKNRKPDVVAVVHLVVVVSSEVLLSLVPADHGGGVAVKCDTGCWMPEPSVTFLDEHGRPIPAGEPKIQQNSSGCLRKHLLLTLQSTTSSITCRVHEPQFNLTREAQISIPEVCLGSNTWIVLQTVFFTSVTCFTFFVVGILLWKCCCPSASKKMLRNQESNGSSSSDRWTLLSVKTQRQHRKSTHSTSPAPSAHCTAQTSGDASPEHASRTSCPEGEQLINQQPEASAESSSLISSNSPKRRSGKAGLQRQNSVSVPGNRSQPSPKAASAVPGECPSSSNLPQDKPSKQRRCSNPVPSCSAPIRPWIVSNPGFKSLSKSLPPRSSSFSSVSCGVHQSLSGRSIDSSLNWKSSTLTVHNRYGPLADLPE